MSSKGFTGANLLKAELDQRVVQEFTRFQATDIAIRDVEGASSRAVSQNASGGSIEEHNQQEAPYTSSGSGIGENCCCSTPESRAERRTTMSAVGATSVRLYKRSGHDISKLASLTT
jgi:hypothetical protein